MRSLSFPVAIGFAVALAAPCALLAGAPAPNRTVSSQINLRIDLKAPSKAISPDIFGIFFEDINYSADGGLYAELVQNRSFEYNSSEQPAWNELSCWTTVTRGQGSGRVAVRTAKPLHVYNPHYISIDVKAPGDGVGVSNSGYDGIPVRAGDSYEVSFFAHQLFMNEPWGGDNAIDGRPMPVTVRLEAESGEVLAEASTKVVGRDWVRHGLKLTPSRNDPQAKLVVLAHARGGIALDEISLFPEKTYRGRRNGLRADLAQAIADMAPRFVRFPGGCLAHGDGVNNFYRWKDTIGPVEQRRGQRNLWGYHQSVGLGYFEYFQFCEDIGAKPLPVVSAGVSCQNSDYSPGNGQQCLPMAEMDAYVQDILDLIEWANGPVDSTWGAKRAAAGHPTSFGLKYLGVGNEDRITPGFEARFKYIQDAIRARHPEIVVVGTVGPAPDGEDFDLGWAFARKASVAMVDEHYYKPTGWFWDNIHRYDSYSRKGPAVYVGEYAAHEKDRRNTLRSALAEAAGCIGFERNGDIVQLSSAAPLLARRGHTQWTPDLIYFTGTSVYPSLNYEVQRLFCRNSGDSLLEASAQGLSSDAHVAYSVVRESASGDIIVKLVNDEDSSLSASVALGSAPVGGYALTTTTLSAESADLANEDGKPAVALPEIKATRVEGTFTQSFPAHSLTVLRLR